jgi:hypothetical protein
MSIVNNISQPNLIKTNKRYWPCTSEQKTFIDLLLSNKIEEAENYYLSKKDIIKNNNPVISVNGFIDNKSLIIYLYDKQIYQAKLGASLLYKYGANPFAKKLYKYKDKTAEFTKPTQKYVLGSFKEQVGWYIDAFDGKFAGDDDGIINPRVFLFKNEELIDKYIEYKINKADLNFVRKEDVLKNSLLEMLDLNLKYFYKNITIGSLDVLKKVFIKHNHLDLFLNKIFNCLSPYSNLKTKTNYFNYLTAQVDCLYNDKDLLKKMITDNYEKQITIDNKTDTWMREYNFKNDNNLIFNLICFYVFGTKDYKKGIELIKNKNLHENIDFLKEFYLFLIKSKTTYKTFYNLKKELNIQKSLNKKIWMDIIDDDLIKNKYFINIILKFKKSSIDISKFIKEIINNINPDLKNSEVFVENLMLSLDNNFEKSKKAKYYNYFVSLIKNKIIDVKYNKDLILSFLKQNNQQKTLMFFEKTILDDMLKNSKVAKTKARI